MKYDNTYYDTVWANVIKLLPVGGPIRFDMRQYIYSEVMKHVPEGSKVFDYACGLGLIDIRLEKEKGCKCYGCDFSAVAVEYVNMNIKRGEFRHTSELFGDWYDVILGIAYMEHTNQPRKWVDAMLEHTNKLIVTIPNNYRQQGEHYLMQWSNWGEFVSILRGLKWKRVDNYQDKNHHQAWKSPIIIISKEEDMHPNYRDDELIKEGKNIPLGKKPKKKPKKVEAPKEEVKKEETE